MRQRIAIVRICYKRRGMDIAIAINAAEGLGQAEFGRSLAVFRPHLGGAPQRFGYSRGCEEPRPI